MGEPMINLFQDQETQINQVVASMKQGYKRILMQAATGAGKTVMASEMLSRAGRKGSTTWFVVPRKELLRQTSKTYEQFGIEHSFIASGYQYDSWADNHIVSLQTLPRRLDKLTPPDMVMIDECFVAGTKISTPDGVKNIEDVKTGDSVYNATGIGHVVAISKRKTQKIIKVRLNDGTEFTCTPNHPVLSRQGWVNAENLVSGEILVGLQNMPELWKTLSSKNNKKEKRKNRAKGHKEVYQNEVLLNILLEEDGKSNVDRWCEGENVKNFKENRASAINSWWQWSASNKTRSYDKGDDGGRLGDAIYIHDKSAKRQRYPNSLQDRLREREAKGCNRGGWAESRGFGASKTRQEKRQFFNFPRVESIAIEESTCGEFVYNMEVSSHPSYFANGILVHNCHYGGKNMNTFIEWLVDAWIIGLSATPKKHNGDGMDKWYQDMVLGTPMKELIRLGRLSDYKMFAPSRPDLSSVKVTAGDYNKKGLQDWMDDHGSVLIGDAVSTYKENAMGKLGLTFCSSIKESQRIAEAYKQGGVSAAHLDGTMSAEVRAAIIERFANREILQLCSVDLMTFGFDLAAQVGRDVVIECMSDLAPTKSEAKQLQKWGRVLRRKDEPALIFDHVNNCLEHGMPCEERKWSLKGRDKKRRGQAAVREVQMKQCNECGFCHAPAPHCLNCGNIYPVQSRKIKEVDGELEEIKEVKRVKKQRRMEIGMAKSYEDLKKIGEQRGYSKGWAFVLAKKKGLL